MTPRRLIDRPELSNLFGPLDATIKRRLRQVLSQPRRFWPRDYGIILRGEERVLTLWQAVIAVDPSFPARGPVGDAPWPRYPDQLLIARAIKYAASRKV